MAKITPYKEGRTERLQVRLTPEAKAKLKTYADKRNQTMADAIDELIAHVDELTNYGRNDPTLAP